MVLEKEDWIEPRKPADQTTLPELLKKVDLGEAEAILLALELKADFLLIDEQTGRAVAETYGLKVTGILGVLVQAKQKGLISEIRSYMERLRDEAGFRIHPGLFERILKMAGEL